MKEAVHVLVQMATVETTVKVSPYVIYKVIIIIYNCAVDRE